MAFVEGINQYQNSTASNTQTLNTVKETIRPVSSYGLELVPGKIFEGTVTEVKNGQVTIGLSDGQTITARMEGNVTLKEGQPMLFEVRSNQAEQITLRPVPLENAHNPTLIKALEAAGLKINEQNLSLVNTMMKEQLPIDKNSLMQMARLISRFPQADVQTLVSMSKLGIAVEKNSIQQFQNYKTNQQSFMPEIQNIMKELPELAQKLYGEAGSGVLVHNSLNQQPAQGAGPGISGANMQNIPGVSSNTLLGFQQQVIGILAGIQNAGAANAPAQAAAALNQAAQGQLAQSQALLNLSVSKIDAAEGIIIHQDLTQGEAAAGQESLSGSLLSKEGMQNQLESGKQQAAQTAQTDGKAAILPEPGGKQSQQSSASPVEQVLSPAQQQNLTALLREFPQAMQNPALFVEGQLNAQLSAEEMLRQIVWSVEHSENFTSASMQKLFYSDEYKSLLRQAMSEQWLMAPENLKEEGAVKELYQRMSRQMEQLQQVLSQSGAPGAAIAKTAQTVQSNLEFMNQLNQLYTYVQLPIKLTNQNAHSDLYVYTNKKRLKDKSGELTALLHLDLEHLGSTDIYIKMQGKHINTHFYMSDDTSFELMQAQFHQLNQRLEEKGYQCVTEVENRKKQGDFVTEFLKQEKPPGKLQRYSFDVKA